MLRVDFHCHTHYSKDSLTSLEALIKTCRQRRVDRVVVTDHNTIAGAILAKKMDPEHIIVGEEIMTTQGELLAIFVQEKIPPGLTPSQAIADLRSQGAFISISHPFDRLRSGHWDEHRLLEILPLVDAIEIFNARCLWPGANQRAYRFAQKHSFPGTVGSDAHAASEIGQATLLVNDFYDAGSLAKALRQAIPSCRHSGPWVHFASRWAHWRKKQLSRSP